MKTEKISYALRSKHGMTVATFDNMDRMQTYLTNRNAAHGANVSPLNVVKITVIEEEIL